MEHYPNIPFDNLKQKTLNEAQVAVMKIISVLFEHKLLSHLDTKEAISTCRL